MSPWFREGDVIEVDSYGKLFVGKAQQTMEYGGWAQFQIILSDGSERSFNINSASARVIYTDYHELDHVDRLFDKMAKDYPELEKLSISSTISLKAILRSDL